MRALVTGGCGFIGSHVVRALLADGWDVENVDKLTYAANPGNLPDVAGHPGYRFVEGDIYDTGLVTQLVEGCDAILNFAAETHVDRSLLDPAVFVRTDVEGVVSVLEAARLNPGAALIHMSTDEVFGSLQGAERGGRGRAVRTIEPVFGEQGGGRVAGPGVCRDVRDARHDPAVLQRVWAELAPREVHPTVRDPRARRRRDSPLRRRTAGARVALRG